VRLTDSFFIIIFIFILKVQMKETL